MINSLRPVEIYFLASLARRSPINLDHAVALVLFHLYNLGYVKVARIEGSLTAPLDCDHLLPQLRNYEFLCLKAVASFCSDSMIKAVEEFDFRFALAKMGYLRQTNSGIFSPNPPAYFLTPLGSKIMEQYRIVDPAAIFRVPTVIRRYVEIASRVTNAKTLSYAPLKVQHAGS
ncbi:MAG: hypothetical protein ACM3PZ_03370 [Bacillota bacterium]